MVSAHTRARWSKGWHNPVLQQHTAVSFPNSKHPWFVLNLQSKQGTSQLLYSIYDLVAQDYLLMFLSTLFKLLMKVNRYHLSLLLLVNSGARRECLKKENWRSFYYCHPPGGSSLQEIGLQRYIQMDRYFGCRESLNLKLSWIMRD